MVDQPRKPARTTVEGPASWQCAALTLGLALAILASPSHALAQAAANPDSQQVDKLRGTVMNGLTHEPIGHALVLSLDNRFATMTDDEGRFEFTFSSSQGGPTDSGTLTRRAFPDPPAVLMARKPGFLGENGDAAHGGATSIRSNDVTIKLVPEALIVGHIQLPVSDYLNRMQVELYRHVLRGGHDQWQVAKSTSSRADGSFRFAGLAPGEYRLLSHELLDRDAVNFDPGGQLFGYPPVYYPSAADFESAQTIRLSPGVTFQANLSPIRSPYYQVRVAVPNAPPFLQVEVWPHGKSSPGYSLGFDSNEGAIQGTLPEGTYTIHAFTNGEKSSSGSINITVNGEPSRDASLVMLPNPSITVKVREEFRPNPDGSPRWAPSPEMGNPHRPSYLYVTLVPAPIVAVDYASSPSLRPANGPEDKSLVIENVQPGRYRVEANTGVGYISSIRVGSIDLLRAPLQVDSGSAPSPMEIEVRDDGGAVEGTISGLDANAPRSITVFNGMAEAPTVYFFPSEGSTGQFRMQLWNIGPNGHFEEHQLPPGAYRVLALDHQDPELQYASSETLAQYESAMQVIEVAADQKSQVHLTLVRRTP